MMVLTKKKENTVRKIRGKINNLNKCFSSHWKNLERNERVLERRKIVLETCAVILLRDCVNFIYIKRQNCNYIKIYDAVDFFWSLLKLKEILL